jgi:2-phospho-L-lactate guanylyltransferase
MSTWAIIPVKNLRESKRRLAPLLSPDERAQLICGFLEHLLDILENTAEVDHILVVTADPTVTALAREHGLSVLVEAISSGLNAAVHHGTDMATAEGAAAVLILPVDLPFARVEDIIQMIAPLADAVRPVMAICGDEIEDGTNALLLVPPGNFTFRYGPGSFQAHLAEARASGRAIRVIPAPGLRFDLDTESDWLVYHGYLVQVADE